MQSAKMRVAAAAATARAAAIQKGQQVRFMIKNNRVTVIAITPPTDTIKLISPVPLDTLYGVRVTSGITDSLVVNFSSRGFAALDNGTTIMLKRNGVPADSVVITKTGMVQQ